MNYNDGITAALHALDEYVENAKEMIEKVSVERPTLNQAIDLAKYDFAFFCLDILRKKIEDRYDEMDDGYPCHPDSNPLTDSSPLVKTAVPFSNLPDFSPIFDGKKK